MQRKKQFGQKEQNFLNMSLCVLQRCIFNFAKNMVKKDPTNHPTNTRTYKWKQVRLKLLITQDLTFCKYEKPF